MPTKTLLYQGLLRSPASWARVGRGYVTALLAAAPTDYELDVQATHVRGHGYDAGFPLPRGLAMIEPRTVTDEPDWGLGFVHPPHLERLRGRDRSNLFVWEGTQIPTEWGAHLRDGTDRVIVPSRFVADAVARAGVPRAQIRVVSYGHDGVVARDPGAHTAPPTRERPFTILTIGAPHWRKGHDELLAAYRAAFRVSDATRLVIKTTYDPGDRRRTQPFEIPSWQELLDRHSLLAPEAPQVDLITEVMSDSDVAGLFAHADVYAAPVWGEAFGLAILDAAAHALPVITTGWSAPAEYLPDTPDLLPFTRSDDPRGCYAPTPGNQVAHPDPVALAARLRWHYENRDESAALGAKNQAAVADRTWSAVTQQLLEAIAE